MARGDDFDTEDSEFFIILKDIPIYNGEYTPIGKVILGLDALKKITKESKDAIDLIRMLNKEKPSMLKPLMMTYEATDGNVDTISKLNRFFQESTGIIKKGFIDRNPDMPSVVVQGAWGNIYNSVLSAIGTPLKAGMSNLALMIERPIATMAGAIAQGDVATLRRASYMYTVGMVDTLQKATKHMNIVFRQASRDPSSVEYIMRKDFQIKNAIDWEKFKNGM